MFTYRVWFKSESACLVNARSHDEACLKGTYQARAVETNNGTRRGSHDWVRYTTVVLTTRMDSPGLDQKTWTTKQVAELINKTLADQKAFEDAICD